MRKLVAVLLLAAFALAGCTDAKKDDDPSSGDSTGTSTGTGSGSASKSGTSSKTGSASGTGTGAPGNRAPVAILKASVSNGSAPLQVEFTINGTDADGDALSWVLSFGDAAANQTGTGVPAKVNHTYASGTHNATLRVSDGKASANQTLSLVVTGGTVALEAIRLEGTISGLYAGAPVVGGEYTSQNTHPFTLLGQPAKMTLHLVWDDTGIDLDYEVFAPDGTSAGSAANYNSPIGVPYDATEPDIVVEDAALLAQLGEWKVVVSPGEALESSYTVDITFG